jgi:hypothetical protein
MQKKETSYTVHELRKMVTARDKALAVSKPIDEGVKYIRERYKTTADSARNLVEWLRAVPSGGEPASTTVNPTEKWHLKFDEAKGAWTKVPDEDSPFTNKN